MLPGTSLITGQWVKVADPDPVDCNNNNDSDPFRCTTVTSPDAILSVFIYLLVKDCQKLKKDFTSVVYQLIVLLLLTLSLLIYSVRECNGLINRYSFIV